jgi:hypothetical protein
MSAPEHTPNARSFWTCPECDVCTHELHDAAAHVEAHPRGACAETTWVYVDKTAWPSGRWHEEPDGAVWTDAATGLTGLAWRARQGVWHGYVVLPRDHPCVGLTTKDLPPLMVHGGITFSNTCEAMPSVVTACAHLHPTAPAGHRWCLGFDCWHTFDRVSLPAWVDFEVQLDALNDGDPSLRRVYRTLAYVQAECMRLAAQLAALVGRDRAAE